MRFLSLLFIAVISLTTVGNSYSQVLTGEDSLSAGLMATDSKTVLSGYGEAKVTYDEKYKTAKADFTRNVLFLGHKFNKKISFFSEWELEHARVEGGKPSGEFGLEQAYLRFHVSEKNWIWAGLFIPRMGIINENHLPTTYFGNDRPFVEQFIIPSTWREIGVAWYGSFNRWPWLYYSIALTNGLDASGFRMGTGIGGGKGEGSDANAANIALSGSLLGYTGNFRWQVSGYYGGSVGLNPKSSDSLELNSGLFGTPVGLVEGNIQYTHGPWTAKALAVGIFIPEANKINRAYASNTAKMMYGAYVELGYDIFHLLKIKEQNFNIFARFETMDMNASLPVNGLENDELRRWYLTVGFTYQPVKGVIIKADYVHRHTGWPNPALILYPYPVQQVYYRDNGFLNIGIGYSF